MNIDYSIVLKGISKKYFLNHTKPTLIESIFNKKEKVTFWALKNINLKVKKGEKIAIVGSNGSGKTTLLKIIAGITSPTLGKLETKGKVVSLIEVGAGFHPELTGVENVMLGGLLVGMSKEELESKKKSIFRFAGIGKFINEPMYTYSTGMKLRLGFSIIVHTNPDILVLDETMSVGDQDFKKKSLAKTKRLIGDGKTVIVVSHYLNFVSKNFERVVWIDKGKIVKDGKEFQTIADYKKHTLAGKYINT